MLKIKVNRKSKEAEGITSFELVSPAGDELPAFTAGAHIDVHIKPGLIRQYSLCNPPGETHRYVIAVLNEPTSRGGSKAMHDSIEEGDLITVGLPRNLFELDSGADHYLLFAGGIGITPMLAMAHYLYAQGKSFALHYCGRTAARLAFVQQLRHSPFADAVHFHLDDGPTSQRLDLSHLLGTQSPSQQLYICGPTGFMDFVLAEARGHGWHEDALHREYFSAPVTTTAQDPAFEVELRQSQRVIVIPAERTVLEMLLEAGVDVASSCEQGICGSCLIPVLEGQPDHRDQFLTAQERQANNCFTPCCSRSFSPRLVLDL